MKRRHAKQFLGKKNPLNFDSLPLDVLILTFFQDLSYMTLNNITRIRQPFISRFLKHQDCGRCGCGSSIRQNTETPRKMHHLDFGRIFFVIDLTRRCDKPYMSSIVSFPNNGSSQINPDQSLWLPLVHECRIDEDLVASHVPGVEMFSGWVQRRTWMGDNQVWRPLWYNIKDKLSY